MDSYKIAFVLDDSLDKPDGVQQYVLTVGGYLAQQGHEVHYIAGQTSRTDIPHMHSMGKNVSVRFNQNRMSIPWPVSRSAIKRLLLQEEFDIIHIQTPYSPMLGARVIRAASPLTGVVSTFHIAPHSRLVSFANRCLRLLISRSLKRIDQHISVSRVAQDFAWETFGIESAVVPNTLRLHRFYSAKPLPAHAKTLNIVFVGRLVERKGCALLLGAVRRLHQSQQLPDNCRVIICGAGPLEADLKRYVHDHKLDKVITFTGFASEEDKPRYMASADVLVFPSTGGESFGIVLLEGMAASRGVVLAGNNPGYASVMGQRPDVLFDPRNEEQFADKLSKYLDDAAARQSAQEWQRQYVRQYDVPNVADEILVVYDQALHKRRS